MGVLEGPQRECELGGLPVLGAVGHVLSPLSLDCLIYELWWLGSSQ